MLWKRTQCSWKGGRFDRELMGRADLAKYTEAASELKNFIVKRTGAISKRRGSDELVNLKNLLGYSLNEAGEKTVNSVSNARIIPLVYEKTRGYYIIIASKRAFLVGEEGIRLSDGTWTRDIQEYELVEYESAENDKRPYYCAVPYEDGDLHEVDFAQSGDTIFLAHKNYPPASIVFVSGGLEFKALQFNNKAWYPPRILSINASGTWGTSSSTKTVSYVATYVKDGIESEPSAEFQYSYQLPWGNTCRLEITVDNGNNAEDPDYYNIYKKDSTGYGIIATTGANIELLAYPTTSTTLNRFVKTYDKTSKITTTKDISGILNKTEYTGESQTYKTITSCDLENGLWASSVTFDFGTNYGKVITELDMLLDFIVTPYIMRIGGPMMHIRNEIGISSPRIRMTLGYGEINSSTTKTVSQSIDTSPPTKVEVMLPDYSTAVFSFDVGPGINTANIYIPITQPDASYIKANLIRRISASFKSLLVNAGYSDGSNTSSSTKKKIETRYIKVEAFTDSTEMTPGTLCFQGVSFGSSWGVVKVFQDDYISPDMTITPPSMETHFDKSGDYPGCVAVNQQRLCYASSINDPFKVWMSCVGDLYNFDVHASIREDDALSFTLSATEFPEINHILECKNIMLFCDSGEWEVSPVSGNALTYKTVSAKMQSSLGCAKELKPVRIGDEILFADRGGTTLRATRYSFATDGYETTDLSVLSRDLTRGNPIRQFAYQQESDSLVWCVLEDGTLGVLVYMKEHEMVAWSRHELGGGFKARGIATSKAIVGGSSEVVLLVERDGDWRVWRLRSDAGARDAKGMVSMDGIRLFDMCVDRDDPPQGAVEVYLGNDLGALGYPFVSELLTIRPEADPKESVQMEIQNATEIEARVIDAGSFAVNIEGGEAKYDRRFETSLRAMDDGSIELFDGDVRKTLFGSNRRNGRIRLVSSDVWPITVLSLSTTYQVELANKTTGEAT